MEFKELDINQILLNNIEKMKFKTLTNVQEKVIPEILKGNDVLVKAQTGSGKTAAFLIPAINNILKSKIFGTKILILAPTRDLVNQIYDTCFELTKDLEINVIKVMGGTNIADQEKKIKNNPDIIIAVIGRLKYFLNKELVKLENLEYIILDEFDKMLDLGFRASIISLLEQIRNKTKSYKTLMFSATLPKSIETLSLKYLKNNFKKIEINEKKTINQ